MLKTEITTKLLSIMGKGEGAERCRQHLGSIIHDKASVVTTYHVYETSPWYSIIYMLRVYILNIGYPVAVRVVRS